MATNSAGIRITQAGVSAPFAADYQFVFNSDWPSLAIAFDTTISAPSGSFITVPHGLGFYPLTMAWFMINGVSVGRFYGTTTFDKNNVYIDNSSSTGIPNADVTVNIKCYNVDISKPVDYFLPQAPVVKTAYDPSTGIKVTKYGKSITSKDLRDFILHSRAQSPAILSIGTQDQGVAAAGGKTISYTNPVGYTPWVLGFASPNFNTSVYQCFPPGGNTSSPAFFQIGARAVLRTNTQGGFGSLVILRDPLILANTLRVVY